ncbi:OST-HTH/LOTUS domain-containing protein [Agrilutibacter solisilvae]|uniref:OST-HTH/LOTUS domain-containing protein n=1 Tax=Agrilutibacter solisilvae TaxID=2763317 RepID=A0A974XYD4_9GAMM|nr:OST-HTH/LOTUS domain-containing protein [Lysobacter solisilvae]QSX78071.1 OST-HTH/LOTUS domain-containing protein [Lysobacter solisilvae]
MIRQAIWEGSDEEGWAQLGAAGHYLNKIRPDFDPRLYGQKKLRHLLREHPRHFTLEERIPPGATGKTLYVRALE